MNVAEGARRIRVVLLVLFVLVVGLVTWALYEVMQSSSGRLAGDAIFGALLGCYLMGWHLPSGLLKEAPKAKFEALLSCVMPIAAGVVYVVWAGLAVSYSGGFDAHAASPIFTNLLGALLFVSIGTIALMVVPLLPFGLLGWIAAGFKSKPD